MRLQLALNVPDLEASIDFYSRMFSTEPYKVKPGYANWQIEEPPLKLVIFENKDATPGSINHLGVETESAEDVVSAEARLSKEGIATTGIDETICCFAEKVETWVNAPDGNRWEWYVKEKDHEMGRENTVIAHRDGAANEASQAPVCCC